jgi:peptide/nickel transport system permease protein
MATSWTRFRRDKTAIAGLTVITLIVATAVLAPLLAPFDPSFQAVDGLTADGSPVPPSGEFWLGTDLLGRDLLSRMIFGARNSLIIGLVANGAAVLIGTTLGVVAGISAAMSGGTHAPDRPGDGVSGPVAGGGAGRPSSVPRCGSWRPSSPW